MVNAQEIKNMHEYDLKQESLITLVQAAKIIPGRPDVSTVYRWTRHGRSGVRLQTIRLDGQRLTSRQALRRFMTECGDTNAGESMNRIGEKMDWIVHTAASVVPNPGRGTFGTVIRCGDETRELSGGFIETTNNRMELLAVIAGVEALPRTSSVRVCCDADYVVSNINRGHARSWRDNGWRKRSSSEEILNADLWQRLLRSLDNFSIELTRVPDERHPDWQRSYDLAGVAQSSTLVIDAGYCSRR